MKVILVFCCLATIYRALLASPAAFKVLSQFIDQNNGDETDDVTGLKLTKTDDVIKENGGDEKDSDRKELGKNEDKKLEFHHFETDNEKSEELVEKPKESSLKNEADDVIFSRLRLPIFDNVKENQTFNTLLPGDVEVNVTVLSVSPFIFEVDGLLDTEECDLLVAIAKGKGMKSARQHMSPLKTNGGAERLLRDWDYNQDGFISHDEVLLVPQLADLKMNWEQVDDMFFMLKMDQNKDGKVELNELKKIDLSSIGNYVIQLRHDSSRLRNVTVESGWVWADEDDLLKYEKNGYFEDYHARLSTLTEVPSILWEMSEPLQIRHYGPSQFQTHRHDSEAPNKDIPCCLYGDQDKKCRVCRYLSFTMFLNDVEEGGELVFPLANNPFKDIMKNSGEWHGYYLYSKTTGSKTFFTVDMHFTPGENDNRTFNASGRENGGEFVFRNAVIEGETVKFEKVYKPSEAEETGNEQGIRYHGKIIEQTQIMGYWWVPGNQRMNGRFFMWNREFEIYSARAVDQSNRNEGCLKAPLKIKPKKGKAVFWYNHHLNPLNDMVGPLNHEAIFAHCEVDQGVKWTASGWLNIIGDGELKLRTWRRGTNLMHDRKKMRKIYQRLGTNEPKREIEEYEKDFYEEIHGKKTGNDSAKDSGYKYKQSSNALQALNLLVNDLSNEQLSIMAANVHRILGLQCM